jgi:hypothetical protein
MVRFPASAASDAGAVYYDAVRADVKHRWSFSGHLPDKMYLALIWLNARY